MGARVTEAAREVTLRPVEPDDAAFLRHLFATERPSAPAERMDGGRSPEFLELQYAARALHERVNHLGGTDQVILLDGAPVGRLWLDERDGTVWIVEMTLLPEHRGAGIGTFLFRGLIEESRVSGRRLALYTEEGGRPQVLYRRLGFSTTGLKGIHAAMEWTGEGGD